MNKTNKNFLPYQKLIFSYKLLKPKKHLKKFHPSNLTRVLIVNSSTLSPKNALILFLVVLQRKNSIQIKIFLFIYIPPKNIPFIPMSDIPQDKHSKPLKSRLPSTNDEPLLLPTYSDKKKKSKKEKKEENKDNDNLIAHRDDSHPSDRPSVHIKKRKEYSKYDFIKVRVTLGEHFYVLSRFLVSRMLTLCKVRIFLLMLIANWKDSSFGCSENLKRSQETFSRSE